MTGPTVFALAGIALFCLGLRGLITCSHMLRNVLAVNVMSSGVFLILIANSKLGDPVPEAMVITGIVVAVATSALALNIMLEIADSTGSTDLKAVDKE